MERQSADGRPVYTEATTEMGGAETTDPAAAPGDTLHPDAILGGRYRLVRPLGAGGMGEIWEALHVDIDKSVALKIVSVRGDAARDDAAAQRLLREARVLAGIDHPNIVEITDFGHTDAGIPFFAMELVHGRPLSAVIQHDAPLPWPRARHLLLQVAAALEVAHAHGVVHRDLKPSNLLVIDDEQRGEIVKVIDFGIAKSFTLDDRLRKLTSTGMVFGSPAYMSPEQARGEAIDVRSDVYSFGCVAYELVCGQRPFPVDNPHEQIYRRIYDEVEALRGASVPPAFEAAILDCLRRDPAARTQTIGAVRQALLAIDGNVARPTAVAPHVPVPVVDAPSMPPRTSGRPPASMRMILAGTLAGAALFAGGLWSWRVLRDDAGVRPGQGQPNTQSPMGEVPAANRSLPPIPDDAVIEAGLGDSASAPAASSSDTGALEPTTNPAVTDTSADTPELAAQDPTAPRRIRPRRSRTEPQPETTQPAEPTPTEPRRKPELGKSGTYDIFPD